MIKVRVFVHYDPGPLQLSGLINKSGIRMSKTSPLAPARSLLNYVYDSPWIPLDPTKTGTLRAVLPRYRTEYHTVLASTWAR